MSESSLQVLAQAWVRITEKIEFPIDYEGTGSLDAYRAIQAIQEQIGAHIVTTVVILKAITPPSMEEFDSLIDQARTQARQANLKKTDITAAIAKVRALK
jgi:hypothetical protein